MVRKGSNFDPHLCDGLSTASLLEKALKWARAPTFQLSLILRSDKSLGHSLEMICTDVLASAHLDNGNPEILLSSMTHFFKFLPGPQGAQGQVWPLHLIRGGRPAPEVTAIPAMSFNGPRAVVQVG